MSEKIWTCWCELQNEMKAFSCHVRVELLNRRKKDLSYRKNISGRGRTPDRVPYNNTGSREKLFSRHWSFKQQHHSYCFIPLFVPEGIFVTALKLAFLRVIIGRSRCLVTNQCCRF